TTTTTTATRGVTRRSSPTATTAHHSAECDHRRTAEGIVGRREAIVVRVLHPDLAGVERDQEIVGRYALRRRREGEEFDARMIAGGLAAPAHDLVVLTARRVAGVDLGGRRDA